MANTILTVNPRWGTNVARPTPGDDVRTGAVTTTGSVHPGLQELANRSEYVRPGLEQAIHSSLLPSVRLHITADAATILDHDSIALWTSATDVAFAPIAQQSVAPTGLTPGSRYPLYIYYAAGAAVLEVGTTDPDDAGVYKTADKTRRYVGFAITYDAGGGTPKWVPASMTAGHWVASTGTPYIGLAANPLVVLGSTAGDSNWHNRSFGGFLPLPWPWPLAVDLYVAAGKPINQSAGIVALRRYGESATAYEALIMPAIREDVISDMFAVSSSGGLPKNISLGGAQVGDTVRVVRRVVDAIAGGGGGPAGQNITSKFESSISSAGLIKYTADDLPTNGLTLAGEMTFFALSRILGVEANRELTIPVDNMTGGIDYYADTGITIRSLVVTGFWV